MRRNVHIGYGNLASHSIDSHLDRQIIYSSQKKTDVLIQQLIK